MIYGKLAMFSNLYNSQLEVNHKEPFLLRLVTWFRIFFNLKLKAKFI